MMKTLHHITLGLILTVASTLLLSACAKEGIDEVDSILNFSTNTPELVEVKAAAATSVTDFYTIGYGSSQWFPNSGGPQRVQIPGSATFDTYKWELGGTRTFFAYSNNLPTDATASIANSGVTLSYTAIPADAANQPDVTLGLYSGNGDNKGEAKMTFYHPLAQVVFKAGTIEGVSAISSISLSGVYNKGTTTLSTSTTVTDGIAQFSWTGTGGYTTVSQAVTLPSTGNEIGVPFMLIPQTFSTQKVTVIVSATVNGAPMSLATTLDSGAFEAGKKTVCTLTVDPNRELDCNLAAYTADVYDDIFFEGPPANEIWYDWSYPYDWELRYETKCADLPCPFDSPSLDILDCGDAQIVSNTYSSETNKGILVFDRPITNVKLNSWGFNLPVLDSKVPVPAMESYCYYFYLRSIELPACVQNLDINESGESQISSFYIPNRVSHFSINNGEVHSFSQLLTSIETLNCSGDGNYTIHHRNFTYSFTKKAICFVKGTLITLADGSKKPVEDITYDDNLRVWNFDKGCYDIAGILWLTKENMETDHYFKCTFSDGTTLNLVGTKHAHRIFNYTDRFFEGTTYITPGKEIFTENGIVKLISCERVDSLVEYVNLMTDVHINCFAEGVLTSARYNNTYPIDGEMKFIKDGRKKRPYREFKAAGISREWYNGLRLGEQTDSLARIKAYVDNCEMGMREKPAPTFWQKLRTWWKSIFG